MTTDYIKKTKLAMESKLWHSALRYIKIAIQRNPNEPELEWMKDRILNEMGDET